MVKHRIDCTCDQNSRLTCHCFKTISQHVQKRSINSVTNNTNIEFPKAMETMSVNLTSYTSRRFVTSTYLQNCPLPHKTKKWLHMRPKPLLDMSHLSQDMSSYQTHMAGSHQPHPIITATLNTVYTQQSTKSTCHEAINAKCSHLLLAQLPPTQFTHSRAHLLLAPLPRTQFTHSTAPNPHARKPSTQNVRISY